MPGVRRALSCHELSRRRAELLQDIRDLSGGAPMSTTTVHQPQEMSREQAAPSACAVPADFGEGGEHQHGRG